MDTDTPRGVKLSQNRVGDASKALPRENGGPAWEGVLVGPSAPSSAVVPSTGEDARRSCSVSTVGGLGTVGLCREAAAGVGGNQGSRQAGPGSSRKQGDGAMVGGRRGRLRRRRSSTATGAEATPRVATTRRRRCGTGATRATVSSGPRGGMRAHARAASGGAVAQEHGAGGARGRPPEGSRARTLESQTAARQRPMSQHSKRGAQADEAEGRQTDDKAQPDPERGGKGARVSALQALPRAGVASKGACPEEPRQCEPACSSEQPTCARQRGAQARPPHAEAIRLPHQPAPGRAPGRRPPRQAPP